MPDKPIPDIVIGRLPIYLRALIRMERDGKKVTSSQELAEHLGISSAQIRKDLSHFGGFGKQGTGYTISTLAGKLQQILKVDRLWPVALVGVGDLGHALVHFNGFRDRGFVISLLFDDDPAKVGQVLNNLTIYPMSELEQRIQEQEVRVAMVAVPPDVAQSVTDELVRIGVRFVLNYAPINLSVPEGVRVQHIDPLVHLQRMTYYHKDNEDR